MGNYFLKVNKDLFKLGLNPTEILVLAQVMEFQANTGDCFISDKTLAANFGVSESTITRTLKALETKGFITRATKSVKGGKERHITVNEDKLTTTVKMMLDSSAQPSNCLLTTVNLTNVTKQNDLIKDNIKNNEKDNNRVDKTANAVCINSLTQPIAEVEGKQAQVMTNEEAIAKYGLSACANRVATGITNCYWIKGNLVKLVQD